MRLNQVMLFGFKSFADKTVISVPGGIAAVVGPNGCGKSNISDAVLWAIGEQSAKTLRADRMDDVIFNGSERRKPMGMAEVSLGFSELDGALTSRFGEFGELTVTRRLFRSGESEYLINKVPCRLKDVRDLLLEAGASFKGHTIIEQGKVDGLINASPVERRGLIEEVAGIAKYKLRKAETMRKLEATEHNLLRVKDIISEVKRQINSLDRQAKKAKTAQRFSTELRTLELSLAAHRLRALRVRLAEESSAQRERRQAEAGQLAAIGALEAQIERLRLEELEAHQTIRSIEQELFGREAEHQQATARLGHLHEQETIWKAEIHTLQEELGRLNETIAGQRAQVTQQQESWNALQSEYRGHEEALAAQRLRADALDRAHQQELETQEELNRRHFSGMTTVSQAQNRVTLLDAQVSSLQREQERLANERRRLEEEHAQLTAQQTQAVSHQQALRQQTTQLESTHHELLAMIEELRRESAAIERERADRQAALTEAVIRLSSVQALEASLLAPQTELRDTLTTYGPINPSDLHGLVADLIEVTSPYERAIETALGEQLQAFVVDEPQTAQAAIAFLKQHTAGRAFFLPNQSSRPAMARPPLSDPHLIGPAASLVTPRSDADGEVVERLIGRLLDHVWVVDELAHGLELAPRLPAGSLLVTVDGDLILPNGALCGGYPPQAGADQGYGLFQQRRSRQELESQLPEREAAVAELSQRLQQYQERLDALTGEEGDRRQALQGLQVDQLSHQKELDRLVQADARLREQLGLIDHELTVAAQAGDEADRQRRQVGEELVEFVRQREAVERQAIEQSAAVARASQAREAAQEQLTQLKVALASGWERVEQASAAVAHLQRLADHLVLQQEEKAARRQWLAAQQARAREEEGRLIEQQRTATAQLEELRERRRLVLDAVEQRQMSLRMHQADEKTQRRGLDQLQEAVAVGERHTAELAHQIDRITDFLSTIYHLSAEAALLEATPLAAAAGLSSRPVEAGSAELSHEEAVVAAAETEIAALKAKLDQLGPVNPAAIEEYQELEQRFEFLTKQESDLTQSMEDLRSAITKINRTTRSLFLETFAQLNRQFGELFSRFFQGGQASLTLLDEDNPLDSGIEIMAQPPGKRLRTIHLLSGGEKALTAISLLMASFLIAPSPFCLLDEIDAPLDEENVRRFTTVLKSMAQQTQFIIVTHNKRTMEVADQLYGVTMEEPGISKMISVRLDMAEQLAVGA